MSCKFWQSLMIMGSVAFLLAGCFKSESTIKNSNQDAWEKRAWIEKAARALRYGEGLTPAEDIDALMAKPKEQIIDHFMKDPRFVDTVLDFNLFFLGLKSNAHFENNQHGSRNYLATSLSPHSFTSARAVWEGKDYYTLFDLKQPNYFQGNFFPISEQYNPSKLGEPEFRKQTLDIVVKDSGDLIEFAHLAKTQNMERASFCENSRKIIDKISGGLSSIGFPNDVLREFASLENISFDIIVACFLSDTGLNFDRIIPQLIASKERFEQLRGILDFPGLKNPPLVQSPMDVLTLNEGQYGFKVFQNLFTEESWFALQNSSTNFNRKRAAYVLKTYFCDDLTPINIALPTEHAGNRHASDPACASCHYKMDPMAGFFRFNGAGGLNLENENIMIFDDGAVLKNEAYVKYMSSWLADQGSGRKWNVGYIRSAKDPKKNTYGESLMDLAKILRSSSEVKQCLTRRMTEFFLGKDQVYDTEWVNGLAQKFEDAGKVQDSGASSAAFKEITKSLLLSQTFVKADPEKDQCYDFAPGHQPSSLPCEISFLINKNCTQCHSANGASAGLDLTTWKLQANGETNFNHVNSAGIKLPKNVTFEKLLESLSSSNESKLMPLSKFMSPNERAQIYKWVNREAASIPGGKPK